MGGCFRRNRTVPPETPLLAGARRGLFRHLQCHTPSQNENCCPDPAPQAAAAFLGDFVATHNASGFILTDLYIGLPRWQANDESCGVKGQNNQTAAITVPTKGGDGIDPLP